MTGARHGQGEDQIQSDPSAGHHGAHGQTGCEAKQNVEAVAVQTSMLSFRCLCY